MQTLTHEQIKCQMALMRMERAITELRQAATDIKALHEHNLTAEQKGMVQNTMTFCYADSIASSVILRADGERREWSIKTGDAIYWAYAKFHEVKS